MVEKIPTEIINMILFTNEKETKRAIQAAVDQYEKYRRNTLIKRKRNRKTRKKRPKRHAKSYSKRCPRRKKSRGQGKKRVL